MVRATLSAMVVAIVPRNVVAETRGCGVEAERRRGREWAWEGVPSILIWLTLICRKTSGYSIRTSRTVLARAIKPHVQQSTIHFVCGASGKPIRIVFGSHLPVPAQMILVDMCVFCIVIGQNGSELSVSLANQNSCYSCVQSTHPRCRGHAEKLNLASNQDHFAD